MGKSIPDHQTFRIGSKSDWVKEEIGTAKIYRKPIIPILLEDLPIPSYISTIQYLEMLDGVSDWMALHKLVDCLPGGISIPRVFNASGHTSLQSNGVLIVGESQFGYADLNNPDSVLAIAKEIAEAVLPYLQKLSVGLIPPGHPALASATLAYLLGVWNQMPRLFWTNRSENGEFQVRAERYIRLQDVREYGFQSRSIRS